MSSLRDIKIRIKSVKSTQKITKAMEMIAAAKMKKAQQQAIKGRPYLTGLTEIIQHLTEKSDPKLTHPLLEKRVKVKKVGYVFITANRGLCGAFNANVIRLMLQILKEKNETEEIVIAVGRKGRQTMERISKKILAESESISDKPKFLETLGISRVIIEDFLAGNLDEAYAVYNHFHSTASQKPIIKKLLPVEFEGKLAKKVRKTDYIWEQDPSKTLDELLHRYIETAVYQTILESAASEHSARMMAMRQASDNADEIIYNLTLHYNKGRQAKITKEILEIVAGSEN